MNANSPKDAVVAFLSQKSVILSNIPASNTQGWQTQQRTGGPGAKPETIRFLKKRRIPHRQLHYVTFEDGQGKQWHYTCEVVEASDGTWKTQGGSGGSGGDTHLPSPRVNLGGGGGDQFYAGGRVEQDGHAVTRVCLLSANGILLEDSVEDNVVLFLDERYIDDPLQALLYDDQGTLVGTHQVLPG